MFIDLGDQVKAHLTVILLLFLANLTLFQLENWYQWFIHESVKVAKTRAAK